MSQRVSIGGYSERVTALMRSTTVHTITAMLRTMLKAALFLWDLPLFLKAVRDRKRAGIEKRRQMKNAPHVDRVQMENTREHTAILE